ncbi:FkbM family methyltransferase [Halarcobacter ebronensis]|uniref:Methyltransferase FkbM domain-containing protein n=1 Tax=Halarcobacter ebronensis TaxID=1462615 RepID=A0A4V1M0K9_9BACT|nr:FkbM family methyltransferase [Halarcobacter ebronensis]QKF81099.1 methyltransferase, FkbM family [Halarcobacter ebronensis]RXK06403.1 hypothetical protein CRV07_06845 [Halarcobacter ebronensis]
MYEEVSAKKFLLGYIKSKLIDIGLIKKVDTEYCGQKIMLNDIGSNAVLKQIASYGWWGHEPELKIFMEKYNFDIDTFVDGGANIGFYSIVFSLNHNSVKCIAVEALDRNIDYITKLKSRNNFDFDIVSKAIDANDDRSVEFYIPLNMGENKLSAIGSVDKDFRSSQGNKLIQYEIKTVKTISLKTLLTNSKRSLVKLDIEGNELNVLENSLDTLDTNNIDFILEIMILDRDKYKLFNLMKSFGYKAYLITNKGLVEENKPLTMPYPYPDTNGTLWRNHYFTKKDSIEVEDFSKKTYGHFI